MNVLTTNRTSPLALLALCSLLSWASSTHATQPPVINNQNVPEAAGWQELPITSAPAFSTQHLLRIDMPSHLTVSIAVDPDTVSVGADDVVRYVVVMTNQAGNATAYYEGIHCATWEVKTYARQGSNGTWIMSKEPVWRDFNANMPSHHALAFARQAACPENNFPTRDSIINAMKNGMRPLSEVRYN